MVRALFCEAASTIYIVIPTDHLTFRMRDAGERFPRLLLDSDPRPLWPAACASSGTQALPSPLATRHRRSGGSLPSLLHLLLGSERAPPVCSAATSFSATTDGTRFLCPCPRPMAPVCCRRPASSAPRAHRLFEDSEALFWPMRAASGTRHVAEANRWTNKRPRRRAAALGGRGIRSPGCQPVWLPSGCARVAFSPTLLLHVITRFGKLTCVRHRREIHVSRCERIM